MVDPADIRMIAGSEMHHTLNNLRIEIDIGSSLFDVEGAELVFDIIKGRYKRECSED